MANIGPSEAGFHFLQDYIRCQQYFYWRYPESLEPVFLSPPLIFGRSIHAALAKWYELLKERKPTPYRAKQMISTFQSEMTNSISEYMYHDTYTEDRNRGIFMLQQYALRFPYETWKVLAIEDPLEYSTENGKFTGRIDLAVKTVQGRTYIVDHKTTRWGILNLTRAVNVSDQTNGYLWLWNKVHPDMPTLTLMFNIVRQYKNQLDFKQHLVTKSAADLERFALDADYTLAEIAHKIMNPMTERWVRDSSACFKYNRPCPYLQLCAGENFRGLIGTIFRERKMDEEVMIDDE